MADALSKAGVSLWPGFMVFEKLSDCKVVVWDRLSINFHLGCGILVTIYHLYFFGWDLCKLPCFSVFLHFFCNSSVM